MSDTDTTSDTGSDWPDDPFEPYEDGDLVWTTPLPETFTPNRLVVDPDGRIFVGGIDIGPTMVEVGASGSVLDIEYFGALAGWSVFDGNDPLRDLAAPTPGVLYGVANVYAFRYDTNADTIDWVVQAEQPENYPYEVYTPPVLTHVEASPGGVVLVSGHWHDGFDYTIWVSEMDPVSGAKLWSLNTSYESTRYFTIDDGLGPIGTWFDSSNPGREHAAMTTYEAGTGTPELNVSLNAVFGHYVQPKDIVPTLGGDVFLPLVSYAVDPPGWVTRLTPTGDIVWAEPLHPALYPHRASPVGSTGDHFLLVANLPDLEAILHVFDDGSTTTAVYDASGSFVDLARAPDDALLLLRAEAGSYRVERWVF